MMLRYLLLVTSLAPAVALSVSGSETLQLSKSRLHESLKSLSGKLTLSPEIAIPEPTDPTALLLQSTAITSLSNMCRVEAKANAAFLSGSVTAIQTFCNEQEDARGNFPGPIPVVSCLQDRDTWPELAESGVSGVVITCSLDDTDALKEPCEAAFALGLQAIPEVQLNPADAASWIDNDTFMEGVVEKLTSAMGQEPASILVSVPNSDDADVDSTGANAVALPTVPRALSKQLPILGSISVTAGANRMGSETKRWKAAGYTGAVLRANCLPPSFSAELELVGHFWGSCISDLKSVKSKNFEFRTRNYLSKSAPVEWAKYQKSVIESGALGLEDSHDSINSDGGDYSGF